MNPFIDNPEMMNQEIWVDN